MPRARVRFPPAGARLRVFLGGWWLILLLLQTACATGGSSQSQWVEPPSVQALSLSTHFRPVQLSDRDFHEALTRLMLEVPLRLVPGPAKAPSGRVVFASWQPRRDDTSIEGGYARLCEDRGTPGDCFWLMGSGSRATLLGQNGRFALGLILALSPAVEAAAGVLKDYSANAMTMLLSGLSVYLLMLLAPEPISKGIALTMTLLLWGYLGVEFWELISATRQLWDEAGSAGTFRELRESSVRYGRVLGPNTLDILIVLATWKAGAKGGAAMRGDGLPRLQQVVRNVAGASRIQLPTAVAEAEAVTVAEGRLVLTLPVSSAAVLAMQNQGGGQDGDIHHIATVKNEKSTLRGGPWTKKFKEFFDKAGMSMEDEANKVRVPGHQGPHPQEYHQAVFDRLEAAVRSCHHPVECRVALTQELKSLADEIQQVGSRLNRLVTASQSR